MEYRYKIGDIHITRPRPLCPRALANLKAGYADQVRAERKHQGRLDNSMDMLLAIREGRDDCASIRFREYKRICAAMGREPVMEYPKGPMVLAVIGGSRIEVEHTAAGDPLDKWMTKARKHGLLAA